MATTVVPAWLEDQPRRLLRAVAAGITVIASNVCGLDGLPGVTTVLAGDVPALREAVEDAAEGQQPGLKAEPSFLL